MTIISLISGKGGSGKTSVALSFAQVLAILQYKVLLIDLDTATHGASYFFEAKRLGLEEWVLQIQNSSQPVLLPRDTENRLSLGIESTISPVPTNPPFDFIASKTQFETSEWDVDHVAAHAELLATGLKSLLSTSRFDFVIFDCQAGVNVVTAKALELSDHAVIVTEADSVSTRALRTLQNQFSHLLPRNTKALINKLFLQEKATYDQLISILRNLEFLPPIPFDMDVRDAFARNVIPLQVNKPTSYFSSILRVLKELLPALAAVIEQKTAELESVEFASYEKQLAKLEMEKAQLSREREDTIREIEHERERGERFRRTLFPAALLTASLLPLFIYKFIKIRELPTTVWVAAIGTTISYFWFFTEFMTRRSKRVTFDREQRIKEITELVKELDEKIEKYSTLYLTERRKMLF